MSARFAPILPALANRFPPSYGAEAKTNHTVSA